MGSKGVDFSEAIETVLARTSDGDQIAADGILIWIGSGISLGVLGGLDSLVGRVIDRVQRCWRDTGDDRYKRAMESLRPHLAFVSSAVNLVETPVGQWFEAPGHTPEARSEACETAVLQTLCSKYGEVFAGLSNRLPEDLVLDVLCVPSEYANPATRPGLEHRLLALLISEGFVGEIISTNWDDLVEKAVEDLDLGQILRVVASPSDLPASRPGARLTKIHGCARRTGQDPVYADYIVATSDDLAAWNELPKWHRIRETVHAEMDARRSSFLGLSAQDFNIQATHVRALTDGEVVPDLPLFAAMRTEPGHERILAALNGGQLTPEELDEKQGQCVLGMYACEYLAASLVIGVRRKLQDALDRAPVSEMGTWGNRTRRWLDSLVDEALSAATGPNQEAVWSYVAFEVSSRLAHLVHVYRSQSRLPNGLAYSPISDQPVRPSAREANLGAVQLHRLLYAVEAVSETTQVLGGRTEFQKAPESCQLRARFGSNDCEVFVLREDGGGLPGIVADGWIPEADDTIVIHVSGGRPTERRKETPERAFPGKRSRTTHLYLEEFLSDADGRLSFGTGLTACMPMEA